jgi:hypothetical protein
VTSIQQGSAPDKSKIDSAGERELLIHALRTATARCRLTANLLETIGVSLRHRQVTTDEAMQWLEEEGCLDHVQFGPGRPA